MGSSRGQAMHKHHNIKRRDIPILIPPLASRSVGRGGRKREKESRRERRRGTGREKERERARHHPGTWLANRYPLTFESTLLMLFWQVQAVTMRWWQRLWTTQVHTRKLNPQLRIYFWQALSPASYISINQGCPKPRCLPGKSGPRDTRQQPVLPSYFRHHHSNSRKTGVSLNYFYWNSELPSSSLALSLPVPLCRGISSVWFRSPHPMSCTFSGASVSINRVQTSQPGGRPCRAYPSLTCLLSSMQLLCSNKN